MKKILTALMAVLIIISYAITVSAQETDCIVAVNDITIQEKGSVTVPVEIRHNSGFTNCGIALDYDKDRLELVSINMQDETGIYKCGELASASIEWTDEEKNYGYIVIASAEKITDDGVLFTATFNTAEDFSGHTTVTPVVRYMRSNNAGSAEFSNVGVSAQKGDIVLEQEQAKDVVKGDFNADGKVDLSDANEAVSAFKTSRTLTATEKAAADTDGNGVLSLKEVMEIIAIFKKSA